MNEDLHLKIDAAAALALGGVAVYHGLDYWLVRSGRRPFTRFLRDNWWKVGLAIVFVGLHTFEVFGPWDPYHQIGKLLGLSDVKPQVRAAFHPSNGQRARRPGARSLDSYVPRHLP